MLSATIVFPLWTENLDAFKTLKQILSQIDTHDELLIPIAVPQKDILKALPLGGQTKIKLIEFTQTRFPNAFNHCVKLSQNEIVLLILPGAELLGQALLSFKKPFEQSSDCAIVRSNYYQCSPPSSKRDLNRISLVAKDLSEVYDTDLLIAYKKQALVETGLMDENLSYAYLYDLRLRLTDKYQCVALEEPLYQIPEPIRQLAERFPILKDFFSPVVPGPASKGFNYLFHPSKMQTELKEVFYRTLVRRQLYLPQCDTTFKCSDDFTRGPAISVLVRVHKRPQFVIQALESVFQNDFPDFEVLIIDNDPKAGGLEVLKAFLVDSRFKYIPNPNGNLAQSLNLGMALAKARYVVSLDSDDELTKTALRTVVNYMDDNPECALSISYYWLIDESGQKIMPEPIRHSEYSLNNILRVAGAGALRCWHRCLLNQLGGFDVHHFSHYGEDYDFVLRVSERFKVGRIPEALYLYRQHEWNTTKTISKEVRSQLKILARYFALDRRKEICAKQTLRAP